MVFVYSQSCAPISTIGLHNVLVTPNRKPTPSTGHPPLPFHASPWQPRGVFSSRVHTQAWNCCAPRQCDVQPFEGLPHGFPVRWHLFPFLPVTYEDSTFVASLQTPVLACHSDVSPLGGRELVSSAGLDLR